MRGGSLRARLGRLEAQEAATSSPGYGWRVWELAPDGAGYVCRDTGERRALLGSGQPAPVLSELPGGKWIAADLGRL